MKRILILFLAVGATSFLSSCGINWATTANYNANETQIQLTNNNFKVIDKINGSAEVSYVLIFGGLKMRQLYENAYSAMMDKANLKGGPRAVINIVTEERLHGYPPFYYTRTVTVSAHVIEFTK